MNKQNGIIFVIRMAYVASLLISPAIAYATKDPYPTVTRHTIEGVWEAISDRGFRVFQLEISAQDGVLTFGMCYLDKPGIYRLKEIHVIEKGLFKLDFINDKKERILIYGSGQAMENAGVLEVQLDMNPDGTPNIWKLKFIKIEGDLTYVELLGELSRKASEGRKKAGIEGSSRKCVLN